MAKRICLPAKDIPREGIQMKKDIKITATVIGFLLFILNFIRCVSDNTKSEAFFYKGRLAPAEYLTGNLWVTCLESVDSVFTTATGSVEFEAGARTNWHLHPAGQILL